jgi:tRNA threonylcarbamoyladenosine biosynthesis protein TsaB
MIILTMRTDKPDAEVGIYDNEVQVAYTTWEAHRHLAETLHEKISELLATKGWGLTNVMGVLVYGGPGSFTGLRIGISVANAFAYSYTIPIVSATGETWIVDGCRRLMNGENETVVIPEYGGEVHVSSPKK